MLSLAFHSSFGFTKYHQTRLTEYTSGFSGVIPFKVGNPYLIRVTCIFNMRLTDLIKIVLIYCFGNVCLIACYPSFECN